MYQFCASEACRQMQSYNTFVVQRVTPLVDSSAPSQDDGVVFQVLYKASPDDLAQMVLSQLYLDTSGRVGILELFRGVGDCAVTETEPGPSVVSDDDGAWKKFATDTVNSFYHPVGTCSLLLRKDGGVVGADLKVYGTSNLRVVDNSIIPIILSAHIQTAAYDIAEIAAGKIISAA
ncbi:putative choline dehydrogenase protein [Phaeoacremonium minimum UCRPA7]|uniref:Putative choline dehydrogenase protein n=1 Tax=Phaeoacremonium minimum (strain UCR-PA7) TaxID=1286976 RepID=R8BT42_PHAM7|nr:putative choline dehydrogenase protein [Phaeoacremonium minimum UCRPA7]EOO02516.1 putative choline dehydrogenase protein [Phaeoacremonium minimum UCRPA7]